MGREKEHVMLFKKLQITSLFIPHRNSQYYYHLGFTGPERLRNLPKVTQLVRGRAGI